MRVHASPRSVGYADSDCLTNLECPRFSPPFLLLYHLTTPRPLGLEKPCLGPILQNDLENHLVEQIDLNKLLADITAKAQQEEQAAIAELQSLAIEVGPERLFTTIMVVLTLLPPGSATEATHGTVSVKTELLAYHLVPLFGNPPKGPLTPQGVERAFTLLEMLLRSYIQGNSFREQKTEGSNMSPDLKALVGHLVIDTRVVRGSAYPEQTMQEISGVQGHFEEWFSNRAGIGPRRAIDLLLAILRTEEDLGNEWRFKLRDGRLSAEMAWEDARRTKKSELTVEQQTLLSTAHSAQQAGFLGYAQTLANVPPDDVPVSRELARVSSEPTVTEWQGLIALIGCTAQARNAMHDPVEMQHRPLFVLSGDRLLLTDISNAVDQVWRAFEDIARQDQSFYSGPYSQHRGRWLEQRITELVQRVSQVGRFTEI